MQASDATIAANVARVRDAIDGAARTSGRTGSEVTIVAAVKYVDVDVCRALVAAGVADLGENRSAELERKQSQLLAEPIAWHYIGRVQSRQVVDIARRIGPGGAIHALTSERAAAKLDRAACDGLVLPRLLVQVNVAADPAKDGLAPEAVAPWLDALPDGISVAGLMTMPAFADDPSASRPAFELLRELRDSLHERFRGRHPLTELSMGTTQDFRIAVEEGATHVRLGRILLDGEE